MKLASFYGFTAPMVVMLLEDIGEVKFQKYVDLLDNSIDRENLIDAKKELFFFKQALDRIPYNYKSNFDTNVLKDYDQYLQISNSKLTNFDGDSEELLVSIKQYFMYVMVMTLLDRRFIEDIDYTKFSTPFTQESLRKDLMLCVNDILYNNTFILADIDKFAKRAARSFVKRGQNTPESKIMQQEFINELSNIFQLEKEYERVFYVGEKKITLNDSAYQIMSYFIDRKDLVQKCYDLIKIKGSQENIIFTVAFHDLIYRRPESLFSEIVKMFKTVTVNQKQQFLINVRDNAIAQLELFASLFKERVMPRDAYSTILGLETTKASQIVKEMDSNSQLLFQISVGNLDVGNINEATLRNLVDLEKSADYLNLYNLNNRFGTQMDTDIFTETLNQLNHIGLCGFNLFTMALFMQAIPCLSLNIFSSIIMDDKPIAQFNYVISEIAALLETMRPIGGDVDEKFVHL